MTAETNTIVSTPATETVSTGYVACDREAHRKACAYLKGFIVANSRKRDKRDEKDMTPEFKKGMTDSSDLQYTFSTKDSWKTVTLILSTITFAHILHNRLRHRRPHLGSAEKDSKFLENFHSATRGFSFTKPRLIEKTLSGFGIDTTKLTESVK